jgi:Glycerol dehydrogenase and related enzymes
MKKIKSPGQYIQMPAGLSQLINHSKHLGKNYHILIDAFMYDPVYEIIAPLFANQQTHTVEVLAFNDACTLPVIESICSTISGADTIIVGIGGGKVIDVAKAVAHFTKLPLVVVPTSAATDAPCSAISVLYKENGELDRYLYLDKNPDIILVDTEIILKAPVRLLVAGMGDALSTYFEAKANYQSRQKTKAAEQISETAIALAKHCYKIIITHGETAKTAVETGIINESFEKIVEANIYLSGIGFESGGLAAAHAIHNGMTALPEFNTSLHGEKVAFCTLVQYVLSDRTSQTGTELLAFCRKVGLPVTFAELGVEKLSAEQLEKIADIALLPQNNIQNMPEKITKEQLITALIETDKIGRTYTYL